MKVILSPAKSLKKLVMPEVPMTLPVFEQETTELVEYLRDMSCEELMTAMKIGNDLAVLNKERYRDFCFDHRGIPALLAYDGLQYKAIGVESFGVDDWAYANVHLRILDALYGVLKPLDSLYPYRLEMKNRVHPACSLYGFWGDKLYLELCADGDFPIVNLASGEYGKAIEKYLCAPEEMVTCSFKVIKNGVLKVESNQAKRARGMMTAFIIKHKLEKIEDLKAFNTEGYTYDADGSTKNAFTFIKH